ncbi:MAG: aminotransferase class I/II-fold pyridoxal phosphate-dependent enzyme, partial [Pseudoflavonifractor sp.]
IAISACSAPGDGVMIQPPVYDPFSTIVERTGRKVVSNTLLCVDGRYEMNFPLLEQQAADPANKVMILCSPHNPVGRVWTEAELRRMGEICFRNGVRIVADEIHHDIVAPDCHHIPMETLFPDHKNEIITCTSVSKTFNLAGMAYSNIIIHDPHLKALWADYVQGSLGLMYPNPLAITAVQAAYTTGEDWLNQVNAYIHENLLFLKSYLQEHLPRAKMMMPQGTYFGWVDIGAYLVGAAREDIDSYLVKTADVLIEGGGVFGPGGSDYIRINTACPRPLLEEGIRRICQALDRVLPGSELEALSIQTPWQTQALSAAVDRPTFLGCLRSYGCTVCQLDLRNLKQQYDKLTAAGAKAMVVLQSDPAGLREQIG